VEEDGYSGTEVAKRPGLQKILAMARNGEIDGIGVDDFDRLFRLDLLELGEVLAPLRRAGVWIHTASQGLFDWQSMIGRLNIGITSEGKYKEATDAGRRTLTEQLHMARDLGEPPLARRPTDTGESRSWSCPQTRAASAPADWRFTPRKER